MKRNVLLVLLVIALLCFSNYVFAASLRFEGKPEQLETGKVTGYFIWHDKNGLHLRTNASEKEHKFTGTIRTDGSFKEVFANLVGEDDYVKVAKDRRELTFQSTTSGKVTGFDFYVRNASYVKFDLSLDGDSVKSGDIYIGGEGWHPENNRFTLLQDEYKVNDSDGREVIIVHDGFWWDWEYPHFYHRQPGPHGPYR
ncbi:MAG: hypothetical protein H6Q72_2390 [Firmicutes bacterium]|nr:hypothetical protein [Bacillota bacterium]